MKKIHIGVLCGSARRDSFNLRIAQAVAGHLSEEFDVTFIKIDDLPIFCQDYDDDGSTPAEWERFRQEIGSMDGYLIATPEYNRSYPPLIKNALDIASRPPGQNLWSKKPAALISASPGGMGGFGGSQHLRQVLAFLNLYIMQQPEIYLANIADAFDDTGKLSSERTEKFLKRIADAFVEWVHMYIK